MAEQEEPKGVYHYTFSLSTSGGNDLPEEKPVEKPVEKPAEKPAEPTPESLTGAVIETAPPDNPEGILAQFQGILRFPLRTVLYSGLRWKLRAVGGWTAVVGAAVAYQLLKTGQLLSLQAGELALVWVGCSLPILMVPYSKRS